MVHGEMWGVLWSSKEWIEVRLREVVLRKSSGKILRVSEVGSFFHVLSTSDSGFSRK